MVFLSLKIDPVQRVCLNDVNGETPVNLLRTKASELANVPSSDIQLVYCGVILKDGTLLKSVAGLGNNSTVHALKKIQKASKKPWTVTEADLPNLVLAFKNATRAVNYRTALQRLSRPAVLERIIAAYPALADDPVSLAIIQDPELMTQLGDSGTARRVLQAHPALAEACQFIVTVVHEEAATSTTPSSGYFPILPSLESGIDSDEDEEMEPAQERTALTPSSSITAGQLAAALASARALSTSTTPTTSRGATTAITNDMVGRALGQAMATSASIGGVSSANPTPLTPSQDQRDLQSSSRRLAQYLQQMNELGLRDQTINLQALQASDWNVQEAINLVLSGAMSDLNDHTGE